jgi:hypothetical protein
VKRPLMWTAYVAYLLIVFTAWVGVGRHMAGSGEIKWMLQKQACTWSSCKVTK